LIMTQDIEAHAAVPTWRRIVNFPLVALAIALALIMATLATLSWGLRLIPATIDPDLADAIKAIVTVAAVIAVYKLVLRHLGSEPRDDLGWRGAGREIGVGLIIGAGLISLSVGIAALCGVYRIVGAGGWSEFVRIASQAGLVAGVVEELIFRGILFRWIEQLAGSWATLALTSLLFGLAHIANDNATLFSSLAIALEAGILLGAAYMLTRSLWLAIGIHAAWNIAQGFVWDVPVSGHAVNGLVEAEMSGPAWLSGGPFGLEASVIAMVVATAAGLWLLRMAIARGHLVAPMWLRKPAIETPPDTRDTSAIT